MRRLALLVVLALAALLTSWSVPVGAVRADERSDAVRERVEMIRKLPREEQQRLREALRRFKSLPEAQRAELRRRADRVGPERLRELVGRNVKHLRTRQQALRREEAEIVRLLGGEERFANLSEVERQYLVGLAVRSFQKHVRRTLLAIGGPNEMAAFSRLSRAERRARMEDAVRQLEASLIAAETPESQAEIRSLPPNEQRQRVRQLLVDHRLTLVQSFVTGFEHQRVRPFLLLPPEERMRAAARWAERARWFEIRKHLDRELGVSRDTLRLLDDLGPEDCARIRDEFDRTEATDPAERRLRLEEEIRTVHGRAALTDDGDARARGGRARLRRLLREEKRRRKQERRRPRERSNDEPRCEQTPETAQRRRRFRSTSTRSSAEPGSICAERPRNPPPARNLRPSRAT